MELATSDINFLINLILFCTLTFYALVIAPKISASIAKNNGRGYWGWYITIACLSIFGIWHMLVSLKELSKTEIRNLKLLAVGYFLLFGIYNAINYSFLS